MKKNIEPVGKVSTSLGVALATEVDSPESLLERAYLVIYEA